MGSKTSHPSEVHLGAALLLLLLAATAVLIRIYAVTLMMSWHVWRILEILLVSYNKRKSVILITLLT